MSNARDLVAAFADTLERRDWAAFAELLDPNVVYEIPQTRERIRGRDRYVAFNAQYPGDWHIDPLVVLGDDHDGSLLFRWTLAEEPSLAVAFFEVDGDTITKVTDFWPEPYEPPQDGNTSSSVGETRSSVTWPRREMRGPRPSHPTGTVVPPKPLLAA